MIRMRLSKTKIRGRFYAKIAEAHRHRPKMPKQSLESHKEKLLARLSPKKAHVYIQQRAMMYRGRWVSTATLQASSIGMRVKHKRESLSDRHLPLNAMIFRALDSLVADGKLISSLTYPEWRIQLALGTTKFRHFYLNPETKDKTL